MDKVNITKEELIDLYEVQKLSSYKISEIFDVDRSAIDYWLKKFGIKTRLKQKQEFLDNIKLTDIQKEFLIGSLLGDGHIAKNRRFAKYCTSHSYKQKEYIDWIAYIFGELGRTSKLYETTNKSNNKTYSFYNFWTKASLELLNLRNYFYQYGIKVVPENLIDIFKSPLSLAVWVMEDGSLDKISKRLNICTDCFSYDEHLILQKILFNNFNLKAKIVKYENKHFRLHFTVLETRKLSDIICPYVIESMKYKIVS